MYWYMIIFALISPLIGIYMMEAGALSWSVGLTGYPNGATLAYGQYVGVVFASALFFISYQRIFFARRHGATAEIGTLDDQQSDIRFTVFARRILIINVIYAFIFIFGFGSYKVVLGLVDKGTFRSSLGALGALPNLFTKIIAPSFLACLILLYQSANKKSRNSRILLGANIAITFLTAMTWGFKSIGISMLLPAGVLILWSASMFRIAKYFMYGAVIMIVAVLTLDSATELNNLSALEFLFHRVTVLQGDVSWWVWDQYNSGAEFPPYAQTLLAAFGDRFLAVFGVGQEDLYSWMLFHYDWMINYVAGISLDRTANGHSIVGTPFSEGIIIGGMFGVYLIGTLAGLLIAVMFALIKSSIQKGKVIAGPLLATYFCFYLFRWLVAGGIVQLFHISVLVGMFLAFVSLVALVPRRSRTVKGHDLPSSSSGYLVSTP